MTLYKKWLIIVCLNSLSGFMWGGILSKDLIHWLGMFAGVITWYLIYVFLDHSLIKKQHVELSRKLTISASVKIPLQLFIFPDYFAGVAAEMTLNTLHYPNRLGEDFGASYLMTIFTGFYLSLMCLVIFLLLGTYSYLRKR